MLVGAPDRAATAVERALADAGLDGWEIQDADTFDGPVDGDARVAKRWVCYVDDSDRAAALARDVEAAADGADASFEAFADVEWTERFKDFIPVTVVADRLVVRPPFRTSPRPQLPEIVVDPGLAFGTGSHETTRLVLAMAIRWWEGRKRGPALRVADVGCGTAVIAAGLARLGARGIQACDIDPEAMRVAAEVLAENGVADAVVLRTGSAADGLHGTFDLVVANILGHILISIGPDLGARVRPGGELIVSGVLADEADSFEGAFRPGADFAVEERVVDGEWAALRYRRRG